MEGVSLGLGVGVKKSSCPLGQEPVRTWAHLPLPALEVLVSSRVRLGAGFLGQTNRGATGLPLPC